MSSRLYFREEHPGSSKLMEAEPVEIGQVQQLGDDGVDRVVNALGVVQVATTDNNPASQNTNTNAAGGSNGNTSSQGVPNSVNFPKEDPRTITADEAINQGALQPPLIIRDVTPAPASSQNDQGQGSQGTQGATAGQTQGQGSQNAATGQTQGQGSQGTTTG
ncbi:hypothetical protein BGZ49_009689 [Haplosporangium sp. Z 27]|nr:hypothetical protein BGZ49_009689 [Haplosporangium sp. Z 27]